MTEIGTVGIKEFDQTTIQTIIDGCEEFYENSINKKEGDKNFIEPFRLYEEFRTLIKNLFQVAAKEGNENVLLMLVNSRLNLEFKTIENLDTISITDFNDKYQGWNFNFDSEDFFEKAIQYNEDEVCRRIIDNQRDFISKLVKKILVDRNFDYDFKDLINNVDESNMINNCLRVSEKFLETMLNSKKYHLFQNISNFHSTLDLNILSSQNTRSTKLYLLHVNNNYKVDQFEKYIKQSDLRILSSLCYPFGISTTQALTEVQSRIPFIASLKAIDILFSTDKLNNMAINSLKADSMFLIKNIDKNKINRELLKLAVSKLNELRQSIHKNDSDLRKDIYLKLEKHLTYIYEYAKAEIPAENKLISKIKKKIKQFTFKEKFEKDLKKNGYLSNDSIV